MRTVLPRRPVAAALTALAVPLSAATGVVGLADRAAAAPAAPTLAVVGNHLVTSGGAPLRLVGVNRSGSEYACVQGWGMFDGPVDDTATAAIASWGANTVRVPLNEDCWLGINGVSTTYGGTAYRSAVEAYVARLHAHGLAAVLDLHWAAPGGTLSTGQQAAPDADHAPAFWTSVATAFRTDPSVAFELFNEPHAISWACWQSGCTTSAGWRAAGMQQLVDAVRATGATQPVIADGLNWGGDLSQFLPYAPVDPAHALVAGWHIYNFSGCNTSSCWDKTAAPVAATLPVLLTEVGENDCAGGFINQLLPWADAHAIGYLGWSWNTSSCTGGPALISSYSGTPTAFGVAFRQYVDAAPSSPSPTPAPTTSSPTPAPTTSSPAPAPTTSSPTPAPTTSSPTPAPTTSSPAPPPTTSSPAATASGQFGFEDGTTQGWAVRWGSTVRPSNESTVAYSGTHGLALDVTGSGYPAVGTSAGLAGLRAGAAVTYRVWAPAGAKVSVAPVLYDGSWHATVAPGHALAAGWNTVTFTVPSTVTAVKMLGLQVDDGSAWAGRLVVDAVTL